LWALAMIKNSETKMNNKSIEQNIKNSNKKNSDNLITTGERYES